METDSVWRVTGEPPVIPGGYDDTNVLLSELLSEYEGMIVEKEDYRLLFYPAELVPLQKLPTPALDKHGIAVAQLLTSIHTMAREALGVNLTDHTHFTLDEARQGMLDCVSSFFDELKEEEGDAEKV